MKKILFLLIVIGFIFSNAIHAKDSSWIEDFEKAKTKAQLENKYILINFSGSDWCKWCIKLSNEVFSKQSFQDYAKGNLILLLADSPRFKNQDQKTKNQNQALIQKYGVRGYPTVVLLNPTGKLIGMTGYMDGGADNYIEHLKGIIKEYELKTAKKE